MLEWRSSRRRRRRSGMALALTLMFLVILMLGGLAVSTVAVQNMQMAQADSNSQAGLQVAEAGLAQLMSTLQATPTFGSNGESTYGTLPSTGTRWWADFGNGVPANVQSVNNLSSATAVTRSDGSVIPPYSADLIVSTRVNTAGSSRLVSAAMLVTNQWNVAVASSGTFSATGGLVITGASTLQQAYNVLYSGAPGDLPGNLIANSNANPSVSMKNNNTVTGTITTPGTTYPNPMPNYVNGSMPIPNVTWSFYTPNTSASTTQTLSYSSGTNVTLTNLSGKTEYYVNGDLTIDGGLDLENVTLSVNGKLTISGGLRMNNARIYANGNITISGGIKDPSGVASSTGSIFACGSGNDINVSGSATLSPSNNTGMSMYSDGNINMSGGSTLQGVVYSHGNVTATGKAQFVGVAIANGNTITQLVVTGGASFIYCPVYTQQLLQMAGNQLKVRKLSWRMIQ